MAKKPGNATLEEYDKAVSERKLAESIVAIVTQKVNHSIVEGSVYIRDDLGFECIRQLKGANAFIDDPDYNYAALNKQLFTQLGFDILAKSDAEKGETSVL